jgi:hypothetical protein
MVLCEFLIIVGLPFEVFLQVLEAQDVYYSGECHVILFFMKKPLVLYEFVLLGGSSNEVFMLILFYIIHILIFYFLKETVFILSS